MGKVFLSLSDFENFFSKNNKSFHFSTEDENEAITVQIEGTLNFSKDEYDATLGLQPVHLQSCHIDTNRNHSNISEEVMEKCKTSIYNRPILGYIHQLSDGSYDFAGHEMHLNDNGELEYDEIAVGVIPESGNAQIIYDKDKKKSYLEVDGYIYEEYTRAADILREKETCKVSVELSLLDFSYDSKDKVMKINNFYFTGVTILGKSIETENVIEEGMLGSNITIKDFSKSNDSNDSTFSNIENENTKLIEALEKLNTTLSRFDISKNYEKGGNGLENEILETEEVTTQNETTEVVENEETVEQDVNTETETLEEGVTEEPTTTEEVTETESTVENPEVVETEAETETETVVEKYNKTFELSHDDIRYALYSLLAPYEEANNDWYWIVDVYDNYFIYEGCMGNYFGQKYIKDEDNVAFDGEPYSLYAEFLTESERASLTEMRSNYSSIQSELSVYKKAEELADKMTVFNDEAYSAYLETKEFMSLMEEENVLKFTKEELIEKADAALGRLVKTNKTFSVEKTETKEVKPSFFAFAKHEDTSSYLDSLLKK